jgi:hypothetical protein
MIVRVNIQDHTWLFDFDNEDYIIQLQSQMARRITDQARYPRFDLSLSLSRGGEDDDISLLFRAPWSTEIHNDGLERRMSNG